jgi:4-O-beta-D-mannosyl-D-glucose phosphorylase
MSRLFLKRFNLLQAEWKALIERKNRPVPGGNGIYSRYVYPILTADHIPLYWKYDFDPATNPFLLERIGVNAVFNAGAIKLNNKYLLVARVEGKDRKSYFAVAESPNGVDQFKFWDLPISMPSLGSQETNIYDMRLVLHADGWIYGLFCTECKDPNAPPGNTTDAIAQCGIARTTDLIHWERLPNLVTPSLQQRNVVLHPEFVQGMYAFYTRPQDGFIDPGSGGGIGLGFCADICNPVVKEEKIILRRHYHTIAEAKNGLGPAPLKTKEGWLHLAHGVRNTAAGLRYVLFLFLTDLQDISRVIRQPAGYFMAPENEERIGDVSNVLFCNGWILDDDGTVFIYYASSDTRMHVATTHIDVLLDYVLNSKEDAHSSAASVNNVIELAKRNLELSMHNPILKKTAVNV